MLRLPHELKQLFEDWLETHYPNKAKKVLNRIRQMRGGRLNDPRFGSRMRGQGNFADLLRRRFEIACSRLGLDQGRILLDTSRFHAPTEPCRQPRLFD